MPGLTIKEIIDATAGTLHQVKKVPGERELPIFSHFHFDTRQIKNEGSLFFALKSEEDDGHRYVQQLENRNRVAAVVSHDYNPGKLTLPLIRVKDPLQAAQKLAAHIRTKSPHTQFIGVTGSAGKTTTKEFIYQLLSYRFKTFRSFQNWNNWIGMPFSLLNMSGEEQAAVFELAMSEPGIGEIDLLASILKPNVALILNVFPVHLEYLKTLENIAQAKLEILNYLSPDDTGFINGDSEPLLLKLRHTPQSSTRKSIKILFGRNPGNNIRLKEITRLSNGEYGETQMVIDFSGEIIRFVTPFINRIHLENLFAAIIVARHLGMNDEEIQEAVKILTPLHNRGEITRLGPITIINETYNSNPEALKQTLKWVAQEYDPKKHRKRIAILGDMLELGEDEIQFHQEVGRFFAQLNFDGLVTVGKRALYIAEGAQNNGYPPQEIQQFANASDAGKYLKKLTSQWETPKEEIILLFKASRGIQLEKALQELDR